MLTWYAVQVKRHHERRVERYLCHTGISVLLPFLEVVRRFRKRRVAVLEPLFPGYLFAQVEWMEASPYGWYTLRWSPGVNRVLGDGEMPIPVPDGVIDAIRERTREFGFVRPGLQYRTGSKVRIRHGPFADLEAVFDKPLSRSGRVCVLLQLLGRQATVEVDVLDLEMA